MENPSSSPTGTWWSPTATPSCTTQTSKTSPFSSSEIRLGTSLSSPSGASGHVRDSATTHIDIVLRARAKHIPVRIVHNASIMNAVGASGLQLYTFGQAVSLVFFTDTWKPDSFYARIKENSDLGLHTLVLLDIKVKEQSEENLARFVSRAMLTLGC